MDAEEIIHVKNRLSKKLEQFEWFGGCRVSVNNDGIFIIKVIAHWITDIIINTVPKNFENVDVVLKDMTKEEFQGE
jgi:hypothetical protein